jgi:hypothetical protein
MYLNTRLLGEAIRDSGIPLWELANLACVGADELVYLDALERLPLGAVVRLADALGLPLGPVFSATRSEQTDQPDETSLVGACLGENPRGLTRDDLARALGWDLDRIEGALQQLDHLLSGAGLRLGSHGGYIRLTSMPGRLSPEIRAALQRSHPANGIVSEEVAEEVCAALQRDSRDKPNSQKEYQTPPNGGREEASEPVVFSLMLSREAEQ